MLPNRRPRFHSLPGTWLVSNPSQSKSSIKPSISELPQYHRQAGGGESSSLTFTSRPSDIKSRQC
jgi:hypothetical protein